MKKNEQIMFEFLGEGGGHRITRIFTEKDEKFISSHNEFDPTDEGLDINESKEYKSFEEPFRKLNRRYPWYMLSVQQVHDSVREIVIIGLVEILNKKGIAPEDLNRSKSKLEDKLGVKLEFGHAPLKNGLQEIVVTNLIKQTEFDYKEYTDVSGKDDRLQGKYEVWTEGEDLNFENFETLHNGPYGFTTTGILEVSGSSIIIRNEYGQIANVFPSDKYFVQANSKLGLGLEWFYKHK